MITPPDRRDESRARLVYAMYHGLGSYTEQEAKKFDQWRDKTLRENFLHLKHEISEVEKNINQKMPMTYLVHNCDDLVGLSAILLAQVMQMAGLEFPDPLGKGLQKVEILKRDKDRK